MVKTIFNTFFRGKKEKSGEVAPASAAAKKSRVADSVMGLSAEDEQTQFARQRIQARDAVRKIDAIEHEMTRDMGRPRTRVAPPTEALGADSTGLAAPTEPMPDRPPMEFESTLPMSMHSTDFLLGQATDISLAEEIVQTESVPLLDEAAVLYANNQIDSTEQMLISAIKSGQLGAATSTAWHMLFDLYLMTHNRAKFESLSLDYAARFETSPPLWPEHLLADPGLEAAADKSGGYVLFPVKLDGQITRLLEKLQDTAREHQKITLDFKRVKDIESTGAALLLSALRSLKKSGHALLLSGAQELAEKLRSLLQVGRRDESDAPWLLLLEILQLLNFEKAFEEAAIDYCITFEVSPPTFEAPPASVSSAFPELIVEEEPSEFFKMPEVISGNIEHLSAALQRHAAQFPPLRIDCSELKRVEFGVTMPLFEVLTPLGKHGRVQIEHLNYLVMVLFSYLGFKNIAELKPHK